MRKVASVHARFLLRLMMMTAAVLLYPAGTMSAPLALSTKPQYLGNTATPNLVFALDDSGSMGWEYMPDEVGNNDCKGGSSCNRGMPPYNDGQYNTIFYNPAITYLPGANSNGTSKTSMTSANTSGWTAVQNDGYLGTATSNLLTGNRDYQYCGNVVVGTQTYLKVWDGVMGTSGTAPSIVNNNVWNTVTVTGHGLTTGETINVNNGTGGSCSSAYTGSNIKVTVIDANTFKYPDQGRRTTSTDCLIERPAGPIYATVCYRNGIDTNNPFEYRVPPVAANTYTTYGLPDATYTSSSTISTNPFFYVIIPVEHCSDTALTTCVASTVPTATEPYPAPVRYCTNRTNADADAPVSGANTCQHQRNATFTVPRYGKFYREDIVPTTTVYDSVFVNSAGNIVHSSAASVAGFTPVIDRSGRTDCATPGACTYDEEMTNYANWYAYYRTRMMAMKSSAGRAFSELPGDSIRVGFATINTGSQTIDGVSSPGAMVLGVRPFTGTYRDAWFTQFYGTSPNGRTPLRLALKHVGDYYSRADSRGPWGSNPEISPSTELSSSHAACRQSYALLSTDGYWNGSTPGVGDADGDNLPTISLPTSYTNTAVAPYKDSAHSDTLADVAMYYWEHDLRTNLDNVVDVNTKDKAYWQHMVTFTLGLGVQGTLDPNNDLPALTAGTKTWPDPSTGWQGNKIDDMWHAALNGRGSFFSVTDPQTLLISMKAVFADISSRTSSASSVAIDTSITQTQREIYQARFYSGNWSGSLKKFPIDLNTGIVGAEAWDSQTKVSAQNWDTGRYITTWNAATGSGVPFRWANLSTAQQNTLNSTDTLGQSRVEYIRGKAIAGFRTRPDGVLGDIVHTSPIYVAGPVRSYTSLSYRTFKNTYASRTPMVYVSANDGMLHAFDGTTGVEHFAFIPNGAYANFPNFTSPSYLHKYLVDGPITIEDAEVTAGTWKTILVGALGGGGKSVYALDVTNPDLVGATDPQKETNAATKAKWEYTDADLGYVFGEVAIAKMANGDWAAIFGNGYNNTGTGKATLYIVNVNTGALIKKISVGGGTATTPSGMAAPLPVDVNGDSVVDYIYAGDLEGKVWKFDVRSSTVANWGSAFTTAGVANPLFAATDAAGTPQPITSRVEVGRHPVGPGYMVYFGTGKYLEDSDNSATGQVTQSFYGVWDKDSATVPTFTRAHLLQQTIDFQFAATTTLRAARVTSANPMVWHTAGGNPAGNPITDYLGWYMDLTNPANGNANEGERVVKNPSLVAGRIIFVTFLPPVNICSGGGDSWAMELDANDGSRLGQSVWDINRDTSVDTTDYVDVYGDGSLMLPASGTGSQVGAVASPTIVSLPGGQRQIKLLSGTSGQVETIHEAPGDVARGRQSWIRLE